MASLNINDNLAASHQSHYIGLIVICDTAFSKLIQQDKV